MNICQFIPDELRKEFSEIIKNNTQNLNSSVELEARFGYFADNNFNSKLLDNSLYLNTKKHLDDLYNKHSTSIAKIETHKIVDISDLKIRKIQELPGRIYYQRKISDWNYDNKDWGIRFCRSHETEINENKVINFKSTYRRDINRITYIDNRFNSQFFGFKIEISKVYSNTETNYEMELEALPGAILSIDKWWGALKTLYGWSLNAKNNDEIISLKERITISTNLNKLLNGNCNHIILPSIVNRPKTLTNLTDIKNKVISVKLDGFHKILFFCKTGIYSCSPSSNITKISNINFQSSTIIECEYIPSINQFFGFDIMIHKNDDTRSLSLKERFNLLCKFINHINIEIIKVKYLYFPENQINILELVNNSELLIDGLIFHSIGNYEGDIYKWKSPENLTLDFYLQLEINNIYEVYVIKSGRLFKMDIKISDRIMLTEEFHKKIVECRFIPDKNYWEPLKIRHDKLRPNSYEVTQNTIILLKDPITLDNIIDAF
jgi:hypothetical protein